jgi:hypothetical protein
MLELIHGGEGNSHIYSLIDSVTAKLMGDIVGEVAEEGSRRDNFCDMAYLFVVR